VGKIIVFIHNHFAVSSEVGEARKLKYFNTGVDFSFILGRLDFVVQKLAAFHLIKMFQILTRKSF
jgi:hypothetical protein